MPSFVGGMNEHLDNSGKRCNMGAGTPQLFFRRKPNEYSSGDHT